MNTLHELLDAVTGLSAEQQSLVLDFAHLLRRRAGLRSVDALPQKGPEYEESREQLARRALRALEAERIRRDSSRPPAIDNEVFPASLSDDDTVVTLAARIRTKG